ncbi:P-loop containing nucleoside triphosphate hydrolase protein [Pelagophyceae sp. CCMP2097]|nr:P-loop containing nucleoside triphosphate hydrolase protein [Pelagophyceae sp. CCMP2097]
MASKVAAPVLRGARIAIVGRPNVGKSTLFNALRDRATGAKRPQIVSAIARTTRDARVAAARLGEIKFSIVDTAGYEYDDAPETYQGNPGSFFGMSHAMATRSTEALRAADAVFIMLDARTGVTGADHDVAEWLRKSVPKKTRRIALFNKCEGEFVVAAEDEYEAMKFASRNEPVIHISATHGDGLPELLEVLRTVVVPAGELEEPEPEKIEEIRVAILGRANVGKSTLLNTLARDEIALAAATPGVTRDAVEAILEFEKRRILLVDTAGIRESEKCNVIDNESIRATEREIRNCDVCMFIVDASEPIRREDRRLAQKAMQAEALVIVCNKLDATPENAELVERRIRYQLFGKAPTDHHVISCSALNGPARARRALHFVVATYDAACKRISTAVLNSWLQDFMQGPRGEECQGVRYMSQIGTKPPTFALFGRALRTKLAKTTLSFIESTIRHDFLFRGSKVRIVLRGPDVSRPKPGANQRRKLQIVARKRPPRRTRQTR